MVGAYWLKLGGEVDAVVFSGGIGEKGKELRGSVIERCACLGFAIDRTRNESIDDQEGEVVEIGKDDQRKVLVCRTDEQVCAAPRKKTGSGTYLNVTVRDGKTMCPGA